MADKQPYNELPEIPRSKNPEEVLAEFKNELRDHVNRVIGFSDLLLMMRELDSNKQEEYLDKILSSARYMEAILKIVNDYLEQRKLHD